MSISQRLQDLGISLPPVAVPAAEADVGDGFRHEDPSEPPTVRRDAMHAVASAAKAIAQKMI